jgi:transcriptional regulator with XRE-family HTH domain
MENSLHDYVLERLEAAKGHWAAVAKGSGVSKRTIEKIARREIADPGVSHIEKLAGYFRGLEQAKAA